MRKLIKIAMLGISALLLVLVTGCINVTVQADSDTKTDDAPKYKEVLQNVTEQYFVYESVPFGTKQCQLEPYDITKDFKIEKYVVGVDEDGEDTHYMQCTIIVTNHEDEEGTWKFYVSFEKEKNSVDRPDQELTVGPGETGEIMFQYPQIAFGNVVSCDPHTTEFPKLQKCAYQEPITYKKVKVVKERTVEKLVNVSI